MIDKFCQKLIYLFRERQRLHARSLTSGVSIKDYSDYQFVRGQLKGHEECEIILKKLFGEFFEVKVLEGERAQEKSFEEEFLGLDI